MTETLSTDPITPTTPNMTQAPTVPSMRKLAGVGILIALMAGGIGAAISAAAFPAENGKPGHVGATGPAGLQGPAGPAGSAATSVVDTNKVGYCYNVNYGGSGTGYNWVSSAYLSAPTDNNGTLSCPTGTFISLTPVGPDGKPVVGYNAMKG